MELSIHKVRRVWITEPLDVCPHHYLIIQTKDGETLKLSLFNWNGEIENEQWGEGSLA